MATTVELQDDDYAVEIIRAVCTLAGVPSYVDDLRAQLRANGVIAAVNDHDTPRLFEWLMATVSFQGISDEVAEAFIHKHGNVTWAEIKEALAQSPLCPKLSGYWRFHGCRYRKTSGTCAEPGYIAACPLPGHPLRNGRLNQTAYSLFLFIRDIADGDVVAWIDQQLTARAEQRSAAGLAAAREALIGPLRNVFGVSDKVLALALSNLLLAAGSRRPRWGEVGGSFIVVDTLVHNYLHRTGILRRFSADHAYGPGCYQPGGCRDVIEWISTQIDATAFNPTFPKAFPRFVQGALWRYCAGIGLDICNGNRIRDEEPCANVYCRLHGTCDRVALKPSKSAKIDEFSMA